MTVLRRLFASILILSLLLTLCAGAGAESRTVYVSRDGATVYDADGNAVGKAPAGTELTLTGVRGDVCRVTSDGRTAYMMKSDLCAEKPGDGGDGAVQTGSATAYVSRDGAKVYSAKGKVVGSAPLNTAVTVTAVRGDVCRVTANGRTAYMRKSDLSAERVKTAVIEADAADASPSGGDSVPSGSAATPARGTAIEADWWTSDIQKVFARGTTAVITDVATGLAWREQRRGGTNHADVQPLTAADTAVLKRVYGGTWSWTRRAIFVTINGVNYAASMNGMPHGGGSITGNNFNGHHCIHFTNSRTHGTNKVCSLHQAAIKKALAAKL